MWQVKVKNIITNGDFGQEYATEALADAWIDEQISNDGWGKKGYKTLESDPNYHQSLVIATTNEISEPERTIQELIVDQGGNPVLDIDGNYTYQEVVVPAVYANFVTLKAEYEITKSDLSIDPVWIQEQQLIEAEKAFEWGSSLFKRVKARVLLFNKGLEAQGTPLSTEQMIGLLDTSNTLEKTLGSAAFGTSIYVLNQLKIALPQYTVIADYAINEVMNSGYPL